MQRTRSRAAIWGDGFADDPWSSIASVERWSAVDPDELIRFFPRLASAPGTVPAPVVERLAAAVSVRSWRLLRHGSGASLVSHIDLSAGEALESLWFVPPSPWGKLVRGMVGVGDPSAVDHDHDRAALAALDPLLAALQTGRRPPFTEADALALAFHAGLHPGYLWPAAMILHEIATVTGWLGVLDRGRPALMPADVAILLVEAIDPRTGRLRDGRLRLCQFSAAQWGAIATAAGRRVTGRCDPVRLKRRRDDSWSGRPGPVAPRWRRRMLRSLGSLVDQAALPPAE